MTRARELLRRIPIDPYLVMLLSMVALGLLLPAHGHGLKLVNDGAYLAVAGLFFLYGARLSPAAVWAGLTHWRLQGLVFASTFLLFPLVGLIAGHFVRPFLPAALVSGLIFLSLLPSTVQSSIAFTSIARGDVPAALCSASLSNLFGVLLTPALASLIFPGNHAFSAGGIADIGVQILLPFALGQAVRPLIGGWLERHRLLTTAFDRGSILVIVYSAFSEGTASGVWHLISAANLGLVLVLDLAMLGAVVAITTFISRWLGFSTEEEVAIVFCGSKKSMASGLPIANILFAGHAVALVVLPLMIFHQAQLFVCATLARRYARRERTSSVSARSPMRGKTLSTA
jgi:solute carrier family 10 (sodium/bile acid cotransporter), member 7